MAAKEIKELEARVIERAQFWDWYIGLLIRLRDAGVARSEKPGGSFTWKTSSSEAQLKEAFKQAIEAALQLQREELAECLMLAGVGGERALEYARQRAKAILGEKEMEFAQKMGWVPTYWWKKEEK